MRKKNIEQRQSSLLQPASQQYHGLTVSQPLITSRFRKKEEKTIRHHHDWIRKIGRF